MNAALRTIRVFNRNKTSWLGLVLLLLIVAAALLAPWLATHDPVAQSIANRMKPPSDRFILGTDPFGRDVYSRLLWGRGSRFWSASPPSCWPWSSAARSASWPATRAAWSIPSSCA